MFSIKYTCGHQIKEIGYMKSSMYVYKLTCVLFHQVYTDGLKSMKSEAKTHFSFIDNLGNTFKIVISC